MSKARFSKIVFSTNLRVNQWKSKIWAHDWWSVNHNSRWSSVVKSVTVTLSPERNMVTLSQLRKQKLPFLLSTSLSWSPAASVGSYLPVTVLGTLSYQIQMFRQLNWAVSFCLHYQLLRLTGKKKGGKTKKKKRGKKKNVFICSKWLNHPLNAFLIHQHLEIFVDV